MFFVSLVRPVVRVLGQHSPGGGPPALGLGYIRVPVWGVGRNRPNSPRPTPQNCEVPNWGDSPQEQPNPSPHSAPNNKNTCLKKLGGGRPLPHPQKERGGAATAHPRLGISNHLNNIFRVGWGAVWAVLGGQPPSRASHIQKENIEVGGGLVLLFFRAPAAGLRAIDTSDY